MKPMSEIITELRAAIQRGLELEESVTPERWVQVETGIISAAGTIAKIPQEQQRGTPECRLNAKFIIAARNQYRALLEAVSKFLPRHHPYIMPDCQCPTCTILRTLHSALCEEGK